MIAAVIGWATTARTFIIWLDAQHPIVILVLWYALIFAPLFYLFGRAHWKKQFNHRHVLASGMIYLGFALIAFFPSSNYVNEVTGKPASSILISTEDGVIFSIIERIVSDPEMARIIVYVVLPGLLWFLGAYLLHPKTFHAALGKAFGDR